jgi:hypothetical protein
MHSNLGSSTSALTAMEFPTCLFVCCAQVMMRLRGVRHLDPRQSSQLEAAYYATTVSGLGQQTDLPSHGEACTLCTHVLPAQTPHPALHPQAPKGGLQAARRKKRPPLQVDLSWWSLHAVLPVLSSALQRHACTSLVVHNHCFRQKVHAGHK